MDAVPNGIARIAQGAVLAAALEAGCRKALVAATPGTLPPADLWQPEEDRPLKWYDPAGVTNV